VKPLAQALVAFVIFSGIVLASTCTEGRNTVWIRGQAQDDYFYPAQGSPRGSVLFVPGDGGWRGFAINIAQAISQAGYDVYGLDTKRYLESFTGKTPLREGDVMSDFRDLAAWITQAHPTKVSLVGWSEGAGLCLLGAASPEAKSSFTGLITLGLPENNVLGWRVVDYLTWITKKTPNEPMFHSMDYMHRVSPLRLWMLQSTKDEDVQLESSRALFSAASEPKRFTAVEASNHRFEGNQIELYRLIQEGLRWLNG
jgi:pimeloyl-ACP methyl ester carboxylesterase